MSKKLLFCLAATTLLLVSSIGQAHKLELHTTLEHFNGLYFVCENVDFTLLYIDYGVDINRVEDCNSALLVVGFTTNVGNVNMNDTLDGVAFKITKTKIKNYLKIINSA